MRVAIIVFLSLCSCKSFSGEQSSTVRPECKQFATALNSNWQRSDDSSYYKTNYKFYNGLDSTYHDCIIGLTSKQVISYFGKPTKIINDKLFQYLVSPPPYDISHSRVNLCFTFDDNFRLVKTSVIYSTVTIHDD